MEYQDYYATLGVKRDADVDTIKRAYRKLARQFHPDVSKEKNAEEKFKAVAEAWEVLKDPEKRAAYDELGQGYRAGQNFEPPPGWSGFGHRSGRRGAESSEAFEFDVFSDLFSAFYRDANGERPRPRPRQDAHTTLYTTLEALYAQEPVELDLIDPATQVGRKLRVRIPAHLRDGQSFRLKGQGIAGGAGQPAGDLYIELRLIPHPRFEVDGNDVLTHLVIAPWEAVLGARKTVETLGGEVTVTVPAASRAGTKLRLRGRGLPGPSPGDQLISLVLQLPESVTPAARKHYEALARLAKESSGETASA